MTSIAFYNSPIGTIRIEADEMGVSVLHFTEKEDYAMAAASRKAGDNNPHIRAARTWIDAYFTGKELPSPPQLHLKGTLFQLQIWAILSKIGYGETATYLQIANQKAYMPPFKPTSARAVGGAVGSNPVLLIIPCHRVIGANGSLTGYAGGIARKRFLLQWERSNIDKKK